ncbi:hypothetical protein KAF44_28790 (plasmid) [Cupriavidus necator]|nr:hypothetical protein KAF44_28790 [Cupriavidus necator]
MDTQSRLLNHADRPTASLHLSLLMVEFSCVLVSDLDNQFSAESSTALYSAPQIPRPYTTFDFSSRTVAFPHETALIRFAPAHIFSR